MKGTDQACTERKSAYVRVLMHDLVPFPVIPVHLYTGERSKIEGQYAWQLCCLHRTQQKCTNCISAVSTLILHNGVIIAGRIVTIGCGNEYLIK